MSAMAKLMIAHIVQYSCILVANITKVKQTFVFTLTLVAILAILAQSNVFRELILHAILSEKRGFRLKSSLFLLLPSLSPRSTRDF